LRFVSIDTLQHFTSAAGFPVHNTSAYRFLFYGFHTLSFPPLVSGIPSAANTRASARSSWTCASMRRTCHWISTFQVTSRNPALGSNQHSHLHISATSTCPHIPYVPSIINRSSIYHYTKLGTTEFGRFLPDPSVKSLTPGLSPDAFRFTLFRPRRTHQERLRSTAPLTLQ